MKKLIMTLLILLTSLSFTYEMRKGLYIFNDDEFEAMFGPNKTCQISGTVLLNYLLIGQMEKDGTITDDAFKELDRQEKIASILVRDAEGWNEKSDSWKNMASFHSKNCPKTIERTARKIIGKQNMRLMKKYHMTKIFKGDRKGRMDRYGVYWQRKCDTQYEVTYKGSTIISRRPVSETCYDVREPDI